LAAGTGWAIGALIPVLTFIYDLTVGPVCYSLVAELPSTRLRIKTVVLARNVYQIAGMVIGVLQPRFMNPTAWNWGGKTAFFWGGVNLFGLVWTYFAFRSQRASPTPIWMFCSRTTLVPVILGKWKSILIVRITSLFRVSPAMTAWRSRASFIVSRPRAEGIMLPLTQILSDK
jgi:hypothetical protein